MLKLIEPSWSAPKNVHAFTTTRHGGVSTAPFSELNLGLHVGDDETAVMENRRRLLTPNPPYWLEQTHSTKVIELCGNEEVMARADASYTRLPGEVCTVMTADCLPILLCDVSGSFVAAVHAGWRGLANGILENAITCFNDDLSKLMMWIGPAITQRAFEVGEDVLNAFSDYDFCFKPATSSGKYLADLKGIAAQKAKAAGLSQVTSSVYCTFTNSDDFYSYRRDGETGRMATCIWLT